MIIKSILRTSLNPGCGCHIKTRSVGVTDGAQQMAAIAHIGISLKPIQPQVVFTTPNHRRRGVGFPLQLPTQEAMGRAGEKPSPDSRPDPYRKKLICVSSGI